MKSTKTIILILLLTFLFASCQTAQTETPTPESAATDVFGVDQPTEDPESDKPAQKPSTDVESVSQCSDFLWSALGFDVTYQLLADNVDGNGNCEASSSVNAVMAGDVNTVIDTVEPTMFAEGFQPDESFAADGPLAIARGYRTGAEFCIVTVAGGPVEESL